MESRLMHLVRSMHVKFGLENTDGPVLLEKDESDFRIAAMQEELNEYKDAVEMVDKYDALLDLIVFAVGTLERHGFPLLAGFEAVMEANLKKEVGQNGQKRGGFKRDLVKPAGWTSPEPKLANILHATTSQVKAFNTLKAQSLLNQQPVTDAVILGTVEVSKPLPSSDGKIVEGFAPKFDHDKVRVDLLPIGPLLQIANVFGLGARKYFANSYRTGDTVVWSRTYGSILRHLFAFWNGEDNDPELGTPHLANAGTQLMILMEHVAKNPNKDDRFKG